MAQVRIEAADGSERGTLDVVEAAIDYPGLHATPEAKLRVDRADYNALSGVTPGSDRVLVTASDGRRAFGGVLLSPKRTGSTTLLRADGGEEYLRRAQPVGLGDERVGVDDSTLIAECVDAAPELSKGTIDTLAAGETWVFSGETQLNKARTVAIAAGGELEVTPTLVVNYTAQRGTDKTATTLSPSNGSFVEDTFNADEDALTGKTTHLKVYGIGQGSHQLEATVVPADDSGSYANAVTYTNDDWSDGDPEVWDSLTNKDLKTVSALQTWGQTLMADLPDPETRVETVVKGVTVELGDTFHVVHPEEGIDATLRAVRVVERFGPGGTRYDVTFSSHSVNLENDVQADHRDTERYRVAFEGDLTRISQAPGRGPVDATHDYLLFVKYPDDVISEVGAELLIRGENYRAFSKGGAAGGDHTHSVEVTHPEHSHTVTHPSHDHDVTHPSHDHSVSISDTSDANDYSGSFSTDESDEGNSSTPVTSTFSVSSSRDVWATGSGRTGGVTTPPAGVLVRLYDGTSTSDPQLATASADREANESFDIGPSVAGDERSSGFITVEVQIRDQDLNSVDVENLTNRVITVPDHTHDVSDTTTSTAALGNTETSTAALGTNNTSSAELGTTSAETSDASGDHTHTPDPGLLDWDGSDQSPAHYPEDIGVEVDGSPVSASLSFDSGADDGAQAFEATLDMSGELSSGWNVIAISSTALGHLDATFVADLFRKKL